MSTDIYGIEKLLHSTEHFLIHKPAKYFATDYAATEYLLANKPRSQNLYRVFMRSKKIDVEGRIHEKHG